MKQIRIDAYVLDPLMRDLVGHDKSPSAFIVYLHLWAASIGSRPRRVRASLARIAEDTGLSKSAVQAGLKRLARRRLLAVDRAHRTAVPEYALLRPWLRPRRS
ncbi:MAG: helix-turn-helix domain-containing protein [Candidatus Eisenbacteria bacterium]